MNLIPHHPYTMPQSCHDLQHLFKAFEKTVFSPQNAVPPDPAQTNLNIPAVRRSTICCPRERR